MGNVWSRQARRKRQQREDEGGGDSTGAKGIYEFGTVFGFKVLLKHTGPQNVEVKIRWTKGNEAVLFESFCGMLKRKIEAR